MLNWGGSGHLLLVKLQFKSASIQENCGNVVREAEKSSQSKLDEGKQNT